MATAEVAFRNFDIANCRKCKRVAASLDTETRMIAAVHMAAVAGHTAVADYILAAAADTTVGIHMYFAEAADSRAEERHSVGEGPEVPAGRQISSSETMVAVEVAVVVGQVQKDRVRWHHPERPVLSARIYS